MKNECTGADSCIDDETYLQILANPGPPDDDDIGELDPTASEWLALYGWIPDSRYCGGFKCPECGASIEAGHHAACSNALWGREGYGLPALLKSGYRFVKRLFTIQKPGNPY